MQTRPNVVFIIVDALRARNLGCYGYGKPVSPNIDKLAREGVLFEDAYSCANVTDSSVTTIFSGRYPRSHGILNHGMRVRREELQRFARTGAKLLPEILKSNGYVTWGMDQLGRWHRRGYDYYSLRSADDTTAFRRARLLLATLAKPLPLLGHRLLPHGDSTDDARSVTEQGIKLMKEHLNEAFLMFIHYWDSHSPYNSPRSYVKRFGEEAKGTDMREVLDSIGDRKWRNEMQNHIARGAKSTGEIVARYDGAIAYIDDEIGRLMGSLQQHRLLDDTLVVLTSDHGESLTEHGIFFHHHGLYDEAVHVPLVLRYPGKLPENRKVKGFVQHVDILPTILDLLGIKSPSSIDGGSLIPLVRGDKEQARSAVYAEESYAQRKQSIRTAEHKYIYSPSEEDALCRLCQRIHGGVEELYDMKEDPNETRNIIGKKTEIAHKLKDELFRWAEMIDNKGFESERRSVRRRIEKLKDGGKV